MQVCVFVRARARVCVRVYATIITHAQCRLLRPHLLPPLPPDRRYAFVRKKHAQLLLLGNNVVLINRDVQTTKAPPPVTALASPRQRSAASSGARVAGADDAGDDDERCSKRFKA